MKKIVLDVEARFKLERLCDYVHPKECGGQVLGMETSDLIEVRDVFPVPNVSKKPNYEYLKHGWGDYWSRLYSECQDLSVIGDFHSHPNGTIPSAGDMKAHNDHVLHLWVIHHNKGEHTFEASRGLDHRELQLAAKPLNSPQKPEFQDRNFHLGTLFIDESGKLNGAHISLKVLDHPEKQRKALLKAIQLASPWKRWVTNQDLADALNITVPTLRKWMKPLEEAGDVVKDWGGWRVNVEI